MVDLRNQVSAAWWASALLLAYVIFFWRQDWRMALFASFLCLLAALASSYLTERGKKLDEEFTREDDQVKTCFAEFLQGAPEIQVGNLYEAILRHLEHAQRPRSSLLRRYAQIASELSGVSSVALVLALGSLLTVAFYARSGAKTGVSVALIPVITWVVPQMFAHTRTLLAVHYKLKLVRTSMARLLEYQNGGPIVPIARHSGPAATASSPMSAGEIRLVGLCCQYPGPGGTLSGGVTNITTSFARGSWTALGGPAGSGKSTIVQALLGRLEPQSGFLLLDGRELSELSPRERAHLVAYMPQKPALFNWPIRDNLFLGRSPDPEEIAASLPEVLEASGLQEVVLQKALDQQPRALGNLEHHQPEMARLREEAARYLSEHHGIDFTRGLTTPSCSRPIEPGSTWRQTLLGANLEGMV